MKSTVYNDVLDACIDRITREGATVEECLATYPEHADELEQPLRAAFRLTRAAAYTPRAAAKERGRLRMQAALAELEAGSRPAAAAPTGGWWGVGRLRLAGAFALSLALFVGAPSLVAASGGALPGEPLYSIKRGIEETRLALQPSPSGKAKLHVAFSERRADEMTKLLVRGESERLAPVQKDLDDHLQSVAQLAGNLGAGAKAKEVREDLEDRGSKALAGLQQALKEAPAPARAAAEDSLQASGRAFGQTVDAVHAHKPRETPPAVYGSVVIVAEEPADAAKLGLRSVSLRIERVEALPAGEKDAWVTIVDEPLTVDLMRIADVSALLGTRKVSAGTYTQVRFHISGAVLDINGTPVQATLSAQAVTLVRPFQVKEGATTVLVLGFDAARSIVGSAPGQYILQPVVHIQAQDSAKDGKGGRGKQPRATPTPAQTNVVETTGKVLETSSNSVVVRGGEIIITGDTLLEGDPQKGQTVTVAGTLNDAGELIASKVSVTGDEEKEKGKGKP
jgi:hypothetical protein